MARAKDSPASPSKTVKSGGTKTPGSRPVQARKPAKPAPDAPSLETVSPRNDGERPTPEQLYRMIQETAYFKAKARHFAPGHEVQDWIEAEAEVRRRVGSRA
jgi:DUF2934 family protein